MSKKASSSTAPSPEPSCLVGSERETSLMRNDGVLRRLEALGARASGELTEVPTIWLRMGVGEVIEILEAARGPLAGTSVGQRIVWALEQPATEKKS